MAFVIQDEVFAPRETSVLEYHGPNPMGIYRELDTLARRLLEAKGTNVFEVDFRWDSTEDPRTFFINYFVEKSFDKLTKFRVDFKFYGTQPSDPSREGTLRLEVRAVITTRYSPSGIMKVFFWPFFYFYHIAYYNQMRRRYIVYLKRRIEILLNELRHMLNIPARPS